MNKFDYMLRIEEAGRLKTLKAKDLYVREMVNNIARSTSNIQANNISNAFIYRCITKALLEYDVTRLPAIVQKSITALRTTLTNNHCDDNVTYDTFITTFENLEELGVPSCSPQRLKQLAVIFQDNPIPFSIIYGLHNSSKFGSLLTDGIEHLPDMQGDKSINLNTYGMVLQVEELKRSLDPTIKYSILEDVLKRQYRNMSSSQQELKVFSKELMTQMQNLVTVAQIFESKISNG